MSNGPDRPTRRVVPAAVTMIAYALALLAIGGLTYGVALPGASSATALLIPAGGAVLMILCAVLALRIGSSYWIGMIGIHAALIIPLLLGIGAGSRLKPSLDKVGAFNSAVRQAPVAVSVQTRENRDQPRPIGHQAVGLGSIVAVSGFAFVAILMQRPRVPRPEEPGNEKGRSPLESSGLEDSE